MKSRIPESGLLDQLPLILSRTTDPVVGWDLLLFVNEWEEVPPVVVLADLVEAAFTGYYRVGLVAAGWQAPTVVGEEVQSVYGTEPVQWTCSGAPELVTGCAIIDPMSERVQKVDLFDPVFDVQPGGRVQVWPRWAYKSKVLE